MTAEAQENLDEFLEQLHLELKEDPNKGYTWNKIGAIYTHTGKAGEGVKYLERALELLPEDSSVWNNLGVAHLYLGQALRAIDYFVEAIRLEPDELSFQFNLSICYEELGRYGEAKKVYYEVLECDEKNISALLGLGSHYFRLQDFPKAKLYFLEVLELEPENAVAWANLAKIHIFQNNRQETMRCFHQAVKYDPKDYESWFSLGVGYKMLGEYIQALKCFQVMVKTEVQDDRVDYEMARVVALMGKDDDFALDCLQDAVYAEPSNLERAEKHKEFDRLRHTKKYQDLPRIVQKKQEKFSNPVFIDGNNVAFYENKSKPCVQNLDQMRKRLFEVKFKQVFILVPANLKREIDEKDTYQELSDQGMLLEAPSDDLLYRKVMEQQGLIVSNEQFLELLQDQIIADYLRKNQLKYKFVGKEIQLIMGRDFYL